MPDLGVLGDWKIVEIVRPNQALGRGENLLHEEGARKLFAIRPALDHRTVGRAKASRRLFQRQIFAFDPFCELHHEAMK